MLKSPDERQLWLLPQSSRADGWQGELHNRWNRTRSAPFVARASRFPVRARHRCSATSSNCICVQKPQHRWLLFILIVLTPSIVGKQTYGAILVTLRSWLVVQMSLRSWLFMMWGRLHLSNMKWPTQFQPIVYKPVFEMHKIYDRFLRVSARFHDSFRCVQVLLPLSIPFFTWLCYNL